MTWPPYLALQYFWAAGKSYGNYGFILYAGTVVPMQGLWNCFVYARNRQLKYVNDKVASVTRRLSSMASFYQPQRMLSSLVSFNQPSQTTSGLAGKSAANNQAVVGTDDPSPGHQAESVSEVQE